VNCGRNVNADCERFSEALRHSGLSDSCRCSDPMTSSFRNKGRSSNLDRRTTRQPGYAISLSRRWLVENGFGWLKQPGPLRQVKLRGLEKVDWLFVFSCAAHNLIRLPRLMAQPPKMFREQCA